MASPGRPLDGDDEIAQRRALARLKREIAEARRAEVRARLAEKSVIPLDDARAQIMALANGVRSALMRAPSYLPASLSPAERDACEKALGRATQDAMLSITNQEARHAKDEASAAAH
jgi:hypothetical protein